ncbi:hypothetical protein OUZ56_011810 [Daphnia magna]|uniref:Uncharacterized protein n=1 Tax=Daphnia magna TaxID=35525 RepID=A0ABQ9Z172_9CRUS|nr:hypothetical protein OUZ56_011810 [Daphnia magna]
MAQDGIDLVFEKSHSNICPTMDQSHALTAMGTIDIWKNFQLLSQKIFRNQSNLVIWDSSNTFVEEYIRGCEILERMQFGPVNILDPGASFINCQDSVHPGYSALSQATRILYNDICSSSFNK